MSKLFTWAVGAVLALGFAQNAHGGAVVPAAESTVGHSAAYLKHRADIAYCESTNRPTIVNPAGPAYGKYQFEDALWHEVAGYTYSHANQAPEAIQDAAFDKAFAKDGNWPWTASKPCWSKRDARVA